MDKDHWTNLNDESGSLEAAFHQYFIQNHLPQQPEPTIQFQTPLEKPNKEIPNETSTLYPMHEKHLVKYLANFDNHTINSWNFVTQINGEGSSSKKRAADETIPEPVPTKKLKIEEIPTPFCSCTGTPRNCFKWGKGGWQSTCCTAKMSEYPLPVDPKPRYKRIDGRKVTPNRFKNIFDKLNSEGHDLTKAIDLKEHWKNKTWYQ